MIVEFEFDNFEAVKLRHDPSGEKRVITAMAVRGNNKTYELSQGAYSSWHMAPEIERWSDSNKSIGFAGKK